MLPLAEAAHAMHDSNLLGRCRRWAHQNSAAVGAAGTVADLEDLGVTKGLLQDSYTQVAQLQGRVGQLNGRVGALQAELASKSDD